VIHVVQVGDTIESIAANYGVSAEQITVNNQLSAEDGLLIGQALLILVPRTVHTVIAGDTIEAIAERYGITVKELRRNNPVSLTDDIIYIGQELVIEYDEEKRGTISTNGYVYPYVNEQVYRETLLYLTTISIFSYGFNTVGELLPIDDDRLIQIAWDYGVEPILVLTPFSELGVFSNELVNVLVNDAQAQENLIQNLIDVTQEKGYAGVDIDFEYILAEDREAYIRFVQNITARMNEIGKTVSVALAPKTSVDQKGLLYEGVDYNALGEAANSVLAMTYEWGYTYGPPMAVAPINKVREVIDFAVSQIPTDKIDMGVPNYGYDWPLPYVKGETAARTIGNIQALDIAKSNNAEIQFDELAQSPFFRYTLEGIEHEVWFEDVRSIQAKLNLVIEKDLRGVGYWQLMKLFRGNWLLLNSILNIE